MPDLTLVSTLLLVFVTAIIGGILAKKLHTSAIVGYILGGFVVSAFGVELTNRDILETIANVGVTLLLFTLGVEFSFHRLRKILRTVAPLAILQIFLTTIVILILLLIFGFDIVPALFIACAASLSSTAIAVKVFSERGELDTLPGEVAISWLVVQDLAVIPMMILLPVLSAPTKDLWVIVFSIAKVALILGIIGTIGRSGTGRLLSYVVVRGGRELFLLATVGLVLLSGATTYALGLSAALGAFIAGLLVAETSQNHAVFAEIRPLRDIFAIVFFVTIGMVLPTRLIASSVVVIGILALAILLTKWVIVMGLMQVLGYHRKTAFLVALALTQMSEFGFILSQEGMRTGKLAGDQATLLTALTFTTILIGTPLLTKGHALYQFYNRTLGRWFPKLFLEKKETVVGNGEYPIEGHVVICGYGRVGKYIGRALLMANVPFVVVDYNHSTVASLKEEGIPVVYGDPADKDVLDFAQVDLAKAIVIAIPDRHTQELIIGTALTLNKRIKIICRTHHEEDQAVLKSLGVHTIVQPEFEAAVRISSRLLTEFGIEEKGIAGTVSRLKIEHGLG